MRSLSLLQQIFPTQELNRGLLHYRWILYPLSYQGSPQTSYLTYSKLSSFMHKRGMMILISQVVVRLSERFVKQLAQCLTALYESWRWGSECHFLELCSTQPAQLYSMALPWYTTGTRSVLLSVINLRRKEKGEKKKKKFKKENP